MKTSKICFSCFINDIVSALDILGVNQKDSEDILAECFMYLSSHIKDKVPPSYHITELHRIIKRKLGIKIPFLNLRNTCIDIGKQISKYVDKKSSKMTGYNKFKFLVKWAIAANSLDFRTAGAGYALSISQVKEILKKYFQKKLFVDNTRQIYKKLLYAKNIVYIPDNVGELPFDKLLIRYIGSLNKAKITIPFRGGPITSDATLDDANVCKINEVASNIILSGPDTLGISFYEINPALTKEMLLADVIIAKGQANYYVLSENKERFPNATICCFFTAKCSLVWSAFGCKEKSSIAAIINM
jgi:uncharacterized protein with ATP-grasp and redox domains